MDRTGPEASRAAAALTLFSGDRRALLRTARRFSLCVEDAEDAVQRAFVILLTKAPPLERESLRAWMATVTRREASAVRRARLRPLGARTPREVGLPVAERFEEIACDRPGPLEVAAGRERVGAAASLLAGLKSDERAAIGLQAAGYSYLEICTLRGWTYTKVNRCLAEGRATLRRETTEAG